jgi:hypothetical protein
MAAQVYHRVGFRPCCYNSRVNSAHCPGLTDRAHIHRLAGHSRTVELPAPSGATNKSTPAFTNEEKTISHSGLIDIYVILDRALC